MADVMATLEGMSEIDLHDNPAKAQYALGQSYENGSGSLAPDMARAKEHYEQAVLLWWP